MNVWAGSGAMSWFLNVKGIFPRDHGRSAIIPGDCYTVFPAVPIQSENFLYVRSFTSPVMP